VKNVKVIPQRFNGEKETQEAVLTAPAGDGKAEEDAMGANAGLMCGAETGCGCPRGGSMPGRTCTGAGGPPATGRIAPALHDSSSVIPCTDSRHHGTATGTVTVPSQLQK